MGVMMVIMMVMVMTVVVVVVVMMMTTMVTAMVMMLFQGVMIDGPLRTRAPLLAAPPQTYFNIAGSMTTESFPPFAH